VSAYLCNFLDDHGVKPVKVLKKAGLRTETQADWHSGDAVHALYYSPRFSACLSATHVTLVVRSASFVGALGLIGRVYVDALAGEDAHEKT